MSIERTKDLLEKLKKVHHDLAECYNAQVSDNKKGKVQVMLDYLKDQEERLQDTLDKFAQSADAKALSTYYGNSPEKEKWEILSSCRIAKEITFDKLVEEVLKTSDAYIGILRDIYDFSDMDSQKRIFKDLLDGAKHSRKQFMYNVLMLNDG